jgi:hypothetical protein
VRLSTSEAVAVFGEIAIDAGITAEPLAAFITHEVVPVRPPPVVEETFALVVIHRLRGNEVWHFRGTRGQARWFANRILWAHSHFTSVAIYEVPPRGRRVLVEKVRRPR